MSTPYTVYNGKPVSTRTLVFHITIPRFRSDTFSIPTNDERVKAQWDRLMDPLKQQAKRTVHD